MLVLAVTQTDDGTPECRTMKFWQEKSREIKLNRKPDLLFILLVAFGVGVLITLFLPLAATDTAAAAPVSELQAGVIIPD
jgi:hypothetical protein